MKVGKVLQEYGVLIAFIVLILINVVFPTGSFFSPENLRNLVAQSAYVGIIAIGMTFVILTGGIDLSVGSLVALCGAVGVLALNKVGDTGPAVVVCALACIGVGIAAGFFNGVMIAFGRVAPFVVTLAGLAGFRSLALHLGNGGEIRSQVKQLGTFGFDGIVLPFVRAQAGGPVVLYWSAVMFLVVTAIASFILNFTRYGRHAIAVGANEKAAFYSAIGTRWVKVASYTLLGGLTGISAFFLTARMNSVGTGSVGSWYELDAIAAVVIGGTSLRGGRGRIWGTLVGVLLLTLIGNMMTARGVGSNIQGLVRGVVILVAVLLQRGSKSSD